MKSLAIRSKFLTTNQIIISLILSFALIASAYAERGCCSRHGGVVGCNAATGYLKCRDGVTSPSCKCQGGTVKPVKPVKTRTPAAAPVAAPAAVTPATAGKGCCARHGGVKSCNKSTGYFTCKDGTQSASCKCS